ncbi:uncharacterized protein [Dysidea avara]|uniref:uncharacterized protein isoform X1 n=1 Tax=Dysidea avara TaxID=196820 RepID=UPI00331D33E3
MSVIQFSRGFSLVTPQKAQLSLHHLLRADYSGDTGTEGKDLLQGECVTEGTRRSSKLVSEEASYTVCEEGEVHKQQTAVKVVITQGDTDKKELEDKINLLQ